MVSPTRPAEQAARPCQSLGATDAVSRAARLRPGTGAERGPVAPTRPRRVSVILMARVASPCVGGHTEPFYVHTPSVRLRSANTRAARQRPPQRQCSGARPHSGGTNRTRLLGWKHRTVDSRSRSLCVNSCSRASSEHGGRSKQRAWPYFFLPVIIWIIWAGVCTCGGQRLMTVRCT